MLTNRVKEAYFSCFPWVYWDDFFTQDELQSMTTYFDTLPLMQAEIGEEHEHNTDPSYRQSQVAFANFDANNEWIFHRLYALTDMVNNHFYRFDLLGFDHIQWTKYDQQGSHYNYHTDMQDNKDSITVPRKLSFSVIMNDPSEFEGGDLEFLVGRDPDRAEQKLGRVIAFPSWVLHRVTPVTSGVRKSMVFWACGPKFR